MALETERNWKPYAIGCAVTIVLVVAAWAMSSRPHPPAGSRNDAYAAQVSVTGAQVLAARSLMAGRLVYYDGQLENHGPRTLTGYIVALTFHDVNGKPIETVQRTLLDNHQLPIPPFQSRSFEIGFDQFPAGWNRVPPTPRAVAVYVR
ncbi:MAG: hypothetical protein ACRD1Y_12835 [Terriglobales bacterium]